MDRERRGSREPGPSPLTAGARVMSGGASPCSTAATGCGPGVSAMQAVTMRTCREARSDQPRNHESAPPRRPHRSYGRGQPTSAVLHPVPTHGDAWILTGGWRHRRLRPALLGPEVVAGMRGLAKPAEPADRGARQTFSGSQSDGPTNQGSTIVGGPAPFVTPGHPRVWGAGCSAVDHDGSLGDGVRGCVAVCASGLVVEDDGPGGGVPDLDAELVGAGLAAVDRRDQE